MKNTIFIKIFSTLKNEFNNNLLKKSLITVFAFLLTLSCFMYGVSIAADKLKYGNELLRIPDLPSRPHTSGYYTPVYKYEKPKISETISSESELKYQQPKTELCEPETSPCELEDEIPWFRTEYRTGVRNWSGPYKEGKNTYHIVNEWFHGGPSEVGFMRDWYDGTPSRDDFSVRWEGNFKFTAGKYKFFLSGDDHACLFIDGAQAAEVNWDEFDDKWTVYDETVHYGKIFEIDMPRTGYYKIEYRFYEHMGNARAILEWSPSQAH